MPKKLKGRGHWQKVEAQLGDFAKTVNDQIAELKEQGPFAKEQVAVELGLDYGLVTDRQRIEKAFAELGWWWREAWKMEEQTKKAHEMAEHLLDGAEAEFTKWKEGDGAPYYQLAKNAGWTDKEVRLTWATSVVFDRFKQTARESIGLELVIPQQVSFGMWTWHEPSYWEFMLHRSRIAARSLKAALRGITDLMSFNYALPSGEPPGDVKAFVEQDIKAITDGRPEREKSPRHYCEACAKEEEIRWTRTQNELVEHYKKAHATEEET